MLLRLTLDCLSLFSLRYFYAFTFLRHFIPLYLCDHYQFANWSFAACLCVIVKDLEFVVANKVTRVINCAGT